MPRSSPASASVLHPALDDAAPARVRWTQTALTWLGSVSTALLLWRLGAMIDAGRLSVADLSLAVALAVIAAASAGTASWYAEHAQGVAESAIRRALARAVFDRGPAPATSGATLALGTDATERAAQYRAAFLGPILGALTAPLLVLVVMGVTIDAVTAASLAGLLLVVPLALGVFRRFSGGVGAAYGRSMARLSASFLEAVQSLETLVYARAATRVGGRLAVAGEAHRTAIMRMLAGNQLLILVLDAAFSLSVTVGATAFAVLRLADGAITLGGALAILVMTVLVIAPVDVVGQFFYIGIGGRGAQRRLSAYLADTPPADAFPSAGAAVFHDGEIVLEDVTAAWPGASRPVVSRLDLRVRAGEHVVVTGPSGVGKSTIMALVQGLLAPASGRVMVDGVDAGADPAGARRRIAVVSQRPFLFDTTVAENLRLAAPDAADDALWGALELAGLTAEITELGGLDAPVGEHGTLLSGGQAQRLAIARAALRDAPVLLLDEPTSQVGLAAEAEILAALDRLAAGRTVLMSAHRPGALLAADRVIALTSTETVR